MDLNARNYDRTYQRQSYFLLSRGNVTVDCFSLLIGLKDAFLALGRAFIVIFSFQVFLFSLREGTMVTVDRER